MTWTVAAQNHLLMRSGVMPRWLFWIEAKRLALWTLEPAPVGLWNGEDDLTFTVGGQERVYNGALSTFEIEAITYASGLDVRSLRVTLAANAPETEDVVRGRVIRLAAAELHLALFDPVTHILIDAQPMWRGFVNRAPLSTPAIGGGDMVSFEMVSRMRTLALPGPALKKTDVAQRRRGNDGFRKYGSVSQNIRVEWIRRK